MRRKIIIDCDPGIDDSLAIMLALSMQEEAELLGITIVAGNAPVEMGAGNARKILHFMNRLDIPVYAGAEKPLVREFVNALDTHGPDGLGGSFLPAVEQPGQVSFSDRAPGPPAVLFLADVLLREEKGSVDIIALGPMTNLALLADGFPEAFARIGELVSMGGSFHSHGNCSPVAEYNYWCDPDAAKAVYAKTGGLGKKINMVGLDVTRRIVLTPDLLEYMKRLDPRMGGFVEKITEFYFDFHWEWEHLIGCVINDPLAVAWYFRRELCTGFDSYVDIETLGISRGQSVVDSMQFYRHRPNALVLTEADTLGFFRLFFGKLLHLQEGDLDLLPVLVRT